MEILNLKDIELEWVSRPSKDGSKSGYWRRVPVTRKDPTPAQVEARLRFSEIATRTFGEKGTAETGDGREIPANAALIRKEMLGSRFLTEEERQFKQLGKWEKILLLLSRT